MIVKAGAVAVKTKLKSNSLNQTDNKALIKTIRKL